MTYKIYALVRFPYKIISLYKSDDYNSIRSIAQSKYAAVYSAEITHKNGIECPKQPFILDELTLSYLNKSDTEPEQKPEPPKPKPEPLKPKPEQPEQPALEQPTTQDELICPHCGKKCTSKPGLTLHIKSKHGTVE